MVLFLVERAERNSYQLVGMSAGVYALMGMHYADAACLMLS